MTAHGELHMTVHVVAAVLATVLHRTVQVRGHGAVHVTMHGKSACDQRTRASRRQRLSETVHQPSDSTPLHDIASSN